MRVAYRVDPRFADDERRIIAEGAEIWARGTGGRVCFTETTSKDADLELIRLERQAELKPHDDEWQNHVALCKSGRIWIVAPKVDSRPEYVALVAHELGHHLGLRHIEDVPVTYMHSTINDTPKWLYDHPGLPERDRREFCAVHGCVCSW